MKQPLKVGMLRGISSRRMPDLCPRTKVLSVAKNRLNPTLEVMGAPNLACGLMFIKLFQKNWF